MQRFHKPRVRAIAKSIPAEAIALAVGFLILALMALPAHAGTAKSAGLYKETNSYGHGFEIGGSASGLGEEQSRILERQKVDKTFLLNGTVTQPTVLGSREKPMNLYLSAGAGLNVLDRNYIESVQRSSSVAPAYQVGMGLKYSF